MRQSAKTPATKRKAPSAKKAVSLKTPRKAPSAKKPPTPKELLKRPRNAQGQFHEGRAPLPKKPQVKTGGDAGVPISTEQWGMFLDKLSEVANTSEACTYAGISRNSAYDRKSKDPEFCTLWEQAEERGWFALEEVAKKRAFDGVERPVFYKGRVAGHVQEYSDALVTFLMKGRMRKVFGDKQEVTVNKGGGNPYASLTEAEIDELMAKRLRGEE